MHATSPDPLAYEKPLLRGVSHLYFFFAAVVGAGPLVASARSPRAAIAALIFAVCLAFLFGTSALYHRVAWSPRARQRMRRVDHAAIFLLIAGGYTPLFALVPSRAGDHVALLVIWIGAAVGVTKSIVWSHAPKWVTALVCVALGWLVIGQVADRAYAVGTMTVGLLVASGSLYSVGAIVYALKRPDPLPRVFGYHEVFHAFTIVASLCLYAHAMLVIRAS
jgi:hemolysin III